MENYHENHEVFKQIYAKTAPILKEHLLEDVINFYNLSLASTILHCSEDPLSDLKSLYESARVFIEKNLEEQRGCENEA